MKILNELKSKKCTSKEIQIRTHAADFSQLDIYSGIAHFLDTPKHDIFILVNNVGTACDLPARFLAGTHFEQRNEQLINVNLVSMTKMCELLLPGMEERRRGLVINISSSSSLIPSPLLSVYAATKAYINKLNDCLAAEYRSSGLVFLNLPIWLVSTNMTHNMADDLWVPSAERYVSSALATIRYQESTHSSGYWPHSIMRLFLVTLQQILSPRLLSYAVVWYFCKLRKYINLREQQSADGRKVRLNVLKVIKMK